MRAPSIPKASEWPGNYVEVWAWRYDRLIAMRKDPVQLAGALEYYRTRPVEFINHWCDTYDPRNAGRGKPAYMPFIMFERQGLFIQFLQAVMQGEENATWGQRGFVRRSLSGCGVSTPAQPWGGDRAKSSLWTSWATLTAYLKKCAS